MTTHYYQHPACIRHEPGPNHPESPDRLKSITEALMQPEFGDLVCLESPKSNQETISLVHDMAYVENILEVVPASDYVRIDADTIMSPGTGEAILRAVGGVCEAVDVVLRGQADNAFCAMRPPGHHAERSQAMGFCIFNNVAIAAKYAQKRHGIEKVAVIDFDVHHGNGTQHVFEVDRSLFYGSSHQFPAYPGTGASSEIGVGNITNVPLPPGSGSSLFRAAYLEIIIPALEEFKPDLLLVSAGFDAHVNDPLCQLNVTTSDFAWLTKQLIGVADKYCEGRLVSTLEGGYDLGALADSVSVHVQELMNY